ncbi:pyrrolo-quinoline quinone [Novimethylophilus kurashikiensis]|uniref:Pyrrolo-quinoline quinone n=1 Tax=Novimethylophilus kurashikiensis TaxID=1825523 RepID=A0A2R5F6X5_9PROT|nr:PQQ-binding-like beta-propeller repeat protein [Novimethylophilus kurashikiensis]GBG13990.1 pyrrolo-quinoline quinone [Novimethylophilus kurashikiensis]
MLQRLSPVFFLSLLVSACATSPTATKNADWPSYGRDYSNQRYSPLTQINRDNVAQLTTAWTYKSGVNATFQATPIVVDGVMYLSLPFNHVVALDARDGHQLWRYEHKRREGSKMCCGPANRGVAVSGGKVFIGTVDARLIALDAKTGQVLWDIDAAADGTSNAEMVSSLNDADPLKKSKVSGATGVGIAMAPVVYQGKVIVGITGVGYGLHLDAPRENAPLGAVVGVAGRYGRPGFLAAFDANTGKRVWQFDTIPAEGWEGKFTPTTPDGIALNRDIARERASAPNYPDAGRFGGGSAWSTPAIDPERGLLFFGTGNPSPQMDDVSRPGDNLYTVSLVALDAATGKLRWYYQQVPHDVWGYDVASPPVLFNLERDGKKIPAVGQASKLGWFYVHNRETGELLVKSEAFVPQENMFVHATEQGVRIYPGVLGGVNWSPSAVDEQAQTAFVAGMHWPVKYTLHITPAEGDKPAIRYSALEPLDEARWGLLSAIDLQTGKIRWQHKTPDPLVGGVLATAGNLIFTGEGNGHLDALDATNGQILWQIKTDAGVNAPPMTYEIDGMQYIAVAAGGNQIFGFKQGDEMRVFALKK